MPTVLNLWKNLLRYLTPQEVDANFEAIVSNLDKLGGYTASQTPAANQIPVVKADGSTALPGPLSIVGELHKKSQTSGKQGWSLGTWGIILLVSTSKIVWPTPWTSGLCSRPPLPGC